MEYFLNYFQMYYWRIRAPYDQAAEDSGDGEKYFRETTQMINETFADVNPKLKLCPSLEEAEKVC